MASSNPRGESHVPSRERTRGTTRSAILVFHSLVENVGTQVCACPASWRRCKSHTVRSCSSGRSLVEGRLMALDVCGSQIRRRVAYAPGASTPPNRLPAVDLIDPSRARLIPGRIARKFLIVTSLAAGLCGLLAGSSGTNGGAGTHAVSHVRSPPTAYATTFPMAPPCVFSSRRDVPDLTPAESPPCSVVAPSADRSLHLDLTRLHARRRRSFFCGPVATSLRASSARRRLATPSRRVPRRLRVRSRAGSSRALRRPPRPDFPCFPTPRMASSRSHRAVSQSGDSASCRFVLPLGAGRKAVEEGI
jgi:hypothetical protein